MATHTSLKDYIGIVPDFDLTASVEQGLLIENLNLLRERGLTFSEMADVISPRTLKHRKAKGENLSPVETERAVRVARILAFAEKVFANRDKSLRWLRGKDDRLGNRTPLSLLKTEIGGKLVESMLWQIDEGMFT